MMKIAWRMMVLAVIISINIFGFSAVNNFRNAHAKSSTSDSLKIDISVSASPNQRPACIPGSMAYCIELDELRKIRSNGISRYAITNIANQQAHTNHTFYTNNGRYVAEIQPPPIPGNTTQVFDLSSIEGIPEGFQGYVLVRATEPIEGRVLPQPTPTSTPTQRPTSTSTPTPTDTSTPTSTTIPTGSKVVFVPFVMR